jgi:hypothetical protein
MKLERMFLHWIYLSGLERDQSHSTTRLHSPSHKSCSAHEHVYCDSSLAIIDWMGSRLLQRDVRSINVSQSIAHVALFRAYHVAPFRASTIIPWVVVEVPLS